MAGHPEDITWGGAIRRPCLKTSRSSLILPGKMHRSLTTCNTPVEMKKKIPTTSLNTTLSILGIPLYQIGRDAGNMQGAGGIAVLTMSEIIIMGEDAQGN